MALKKLNNLTGKRFGKLTVIKRAPDHNKHVYWECLCDCGNTYIARADGLTEGRSRSCRKCDFEDLTGKKFGRRTVLCRAADRYSADGYPVRYWTCRCDCGTISDVGETHLTHGKAKSCGCLISDTARKNQTRHGGTHTRLYNIWCNLRARTTKPNCPAWDGYGGRGIGVCDEWNRSFEAFRDWALANGYEKTLTIERIDNNGNYEPSNCRWATMDEQARNKRNTIRLSYNGKTQNVHDWSIECGIPEKILKERYHEGWSVERLLTQPVDQRRVRSHAREELTA